MSAELWFVLRCLDMKPGDSSEYPPGGYTVHRFKNEWWVLWTQPLRGTPLGKEFSDPMELRRFLAGEESTGKNIVYEN